MMKLVDVLAELIVFPGWLAANQKSGRQCEPQKEAVLAPEAPAEPQRLTKNRCDSSFSAHQTEENRY